jgi:hypothetical protein
MSIETEGAAWIRLHGHRAPQLLVDALVQAVRAKDEQKMHEIDGLLRAVDTMIAAGQAGAKSSPENLPDTSRSARAFTDP